MKILQVDIGGGKIEVERRRMILSIDFRILKEFVESFKLNYHSTDS